MLYQYLLASTILDKILTMVIRIPFFPTYLQVKKTQIVRFYVYFEFFTLLSAFILFHL